jgi:transcriptional regulator with XRE-family HTH domain
MATTRSSHSSATSGQFIRLLRQLKGIKQSVVAKKLGITQQALSKLENCKKVNYAKIQAIIAVLNFSEEEVEQVKKLFVDAAC